MKKIKIIIVIILTSFMIYFAFYKSNQTIIEGTWNAKEIVIDGKKLYPNKIDKYIKVNKEIIVNGWGSSINLPFIKNGIQAKYSIKKENSNVYTIKLTSNEKSLNGNFKLEVDTLRLGGLEFKVITKIKSKNTIIHFERFLDVKPWKPEIPKRGKV